MIKYFKELIARWRERRLLAKMNYFERIKYEFKKGYEGMPREFLPLFKEGDVT